MSHIDDWIISHPIEAHRLTALTKARTPTRDGPRSSPRHQFIYTGADASRLCRTIEVLQYERGVSHVCSVCFASPPHTCWLNCNSSDTVGLTPQICKENHDEPWSGRHPLLRRR
jgi:LSD1 subclass zinc finger protein